MSRWHNWAVGIVMSLVFAGMPAMGQPPPLGEPDLSVMVELQTQYGWGAAFGWPVGTNPCPRSGPNWAGVTCTSNNERVESLIADCKAIKLNSRIPPPLARLTALHDLNIRNCGLFGQIGETLRPLTALTRLRLDDNFLSGPIPAYLPSGMPGMLTIYLNRNRLTGAIPAQPNSCSLLTRFQDNFLTEAPADWTFFNRQVEGNCIATLPPSCAPNGNQCQNAPDGSNICTPQRVACASTLTLVRVSGDGQRTQVNTPFANPLQVRVTSAAGSPVSNTLVTFSGPGIVTTTALTDGSGLASTLITANGVVGGNTVTASVGTAMVPFGLTAGLAANCSSSLNVTSTADSGTGTLRQALAEVCPGGIIDLAGIAGQSIALAGGPGYNFGGRLYLGSDVTVEGRGVTINGGGSTRIFFLQNAQVTLKNLTLSNGLGQGSTSQYGGPAAGMGGAIFQNGGRLSLNGVTLSGNVARGGGRDTNGLTTGGGFGANGTGGDLGLLSPLGDGTGGQLGGVGSQGGFGAGGGASTDIKGQGYNGNAGAVSGGLGGFGAGGGGGFGVDSQGLALIEITGGNNGGWGAGPQASAGFGGAIFVRSGTLNLNGVTFSGNSAIGGTGAQGKGGALFLYKGAILNQTNGITFSGNVAAQAGVGGQMYSDDDTYFPGSLCPGSDNVNTCGVVGGNTLTVSVTGNGSVTDSNGLFNCASQCTALYQGSTTLIPVPAQGQVFQSWGGACSGSGNCTVSLASGAATVTATFIAATAPTVTTNPQPVTVTAPNTATFTAAATGNPAPTVQWQVSTNGGGSFTDIPGATSTTLAFATQASQNGNRFRAMFSNTGGTAPSSAALLTVNFAPSVTQDPGAVTVNALTQASFTAAATGGPTPTVKWQVSTDGGSNYTDVSGATSSTLAFNAQGNQNGHRYRAVFTNSVSSATTAAALLTVNKLTPVISWANPASILFGSALGSAQLNATASTPGTFAYTPPAGTVPAIGTSQLSVAFTPTDAINYDGATKAVPITVSSSGTAARIIVTQTLRRDAQTNQIIVTLTLANAGSTAAANVTLTRAAIGATLATTAAPIPIGTINGTSTAQTQVRFPANTALGVLSIAGTYTGGTFSSSTRIVLP
ncbi:MAG: hypothetical protein JNK87_09405 [Bryobacterales bacterium]|nr:hypothetical protein [Bryobacterales bacterium]